MAAGEQCDFDAATSQVHQHGTPPRQIDPCRYRPLDQARLFPSWQEPDRDACGCVDLAQEILTVFRFSGSGRSHGHHAPGPELSAGAAERSVRSNRLQNGLLRDDPGPEDLSAQTDRLAVAVQDGPGVIAGLGDEEADGIGAHVHDAVALRERGWSLVWHHSKWV